MKRKTREEKIKDIQRSCLHERSGDNPEECGKCGKHVPLPKKRK